MSPAAVETKQAEQDLGLTSNTGKPLNLGDATVKAQQAAPGLHPSTALTVAQTGGTTTQKAQVVTHATTQKARASAAQTAEKSSGGGLSGFFSKIGQDVGHPIEEAVSDVGKALNAPLQQVQHEYRYLRDVEARHGLSAAITEGLGMAAGAAVGTLVEPGEGTILGAEAAGELEGHILYKTSWQRTQTGAKYRLPGSGDVVSIGRTVTRLLGITNHSRAFSTMSGVVDGISDLILTPLGQVGSVVGEARSPEGAGGLVGKVWGGVGLQSPDDVERAYGQYASVRKAFRDIAASTAGGIISKYGTKLAPIADRLGDASTAEEVKTVFKEVVKANELRTTDQLPTMTFGRQAFNAVKTAAGNFPRLPQPLEFLMGPSTWSRRLQTVPGGRFDEATGDLETALDLRSGAGATTVYKMVRYSQSEATARMVAEAYVFADPADRVGIFRNAVMDTVAAKAHMEPLVDEDDETDWEQIATPNVRRAIKGRLDTLTGGEVPAMGGEYGKNRAGREMGTLYDPDTDREYTAGVLESQVGKLSVPSFTEVKRMGTMLRGGRGLLGKADDWLYEHVTQGFFKPLVLLTPSYALHMALAEDIPNMLRKGVWDMLKAKAYSTFGRLGYRIEDDDASGFGIYMYHLFGDKLPTDDARLDADAQLYSVLEGHPTPSAVSSGEATSKMFSPTYNASKVLTDAARKGTMLTHSDEFTSVAKSDPIYTEAWQTALREMGRNESGRRAAAEFVRQTESGADGQTALREAGKVATDYLRNTMDEKERALHQASRLFAPGDHPAGWDELDTWGSRIAQSMHGLLPKDDDLTVAKAVSRGDTPSKAMLDSIESGVRPDVVKGRRLDVTGVGIVAKIADIGFRKVLNLIINTLSRQPYFESEYWEEYKQLLPQIEDGQLDYDEATQIAASRAANKAVKFVHNIHTRSQWSETLRNWFPFAFAQEQAYKRAGRLLLTDPGAFRRYQLMIQAVGHVVAEMESPTGTKYFAMPGSGILGKGVPALLGHLGMPLTSVTASFGGEFSSANVIFPLSTGFRPDLSPLASLSAKAIVGMFPETSATFTKLVGGETLQAPLWEQAVPNTFAQRAIVTALATKNRSFADSMVQVIQSLDYEQNEATQKWIKNGRTGPRPDFIPTSTASPHEMQEFVNKVRNQTRVLYGMRALIGLVSPVSPEVEIQTWGLSKELTEEIKKQGSVSKGYTAFLKKNPNATPYTVSESTTISGGTVSETAQAQTWINDNMGLIQQYPNGAMWLMPQPTTDKFSYQVYNEQLADGVRSKLTPTEFLDQLYIAAGNSAYYANETRFEKALTAAGKNETAKTAVYAEWTSYKRSLAAASPIWASYFTGNQRKLTAQKSVTQLQEMQSKGLFPDNPQAKAVSTLLSSYETAENAYIAAGQGYDYESAQAQVKDQWYAYITSVKKDYSALKPVAETVFEDALGTTNVTVGKS